MTSTHIQLRAMQLRARHALLMGESNSMQPAIHLLMRLRDERAEEARECYDEANRIDPPKVRP